MSKPEKVQSSGVTVFCDGVILKRVQNFGSNADISREQIQELGNEGVVQYIADSPEVTITLETNEVGSTDTMALVTDQLIDYTIDDHDNGPLLGIGRWYVQSGSSNAKTITQSNMLNGYCSITANINNDGTSAARTVVMNHCAVTGINLNYDVNGNASENYTLTADNKTWFLNDAGPVRCYKPIFNQIAYTDSGLGFTDLASCIPDGSTVLAIGINNTILRSRNIGGTNQGNATFTTYEDGNGSTDVVSANAFYATSVALSTPWVSTSATSSDRVWIYYRSQGTGWEAQDVATNPGFELESPSGALGAIRRGYITPYLWNTDTDNVGTSTAAGRALRLQTVSIDIAPSEDKLYELGTDGFYGVVKQTPIPITVNVTANDADLEYFAMAVSTAYANTDVKTLTVDDFNGYNALKIFVYQDKAKTTLLKTILLDSMYVSSDNFSVSIGDNATHEMSFECDNITITGSGTDAIGGDNRS